jgi:hypothetical protein
MRQFTVTVSPMSLSAVSVNPPRLFALAAEMKSFDLYQDASGRTADPEARQMFLQLAKAGPLLCAGITVFNPLLQFGVRPTDRVGVVGIGGLQSLWWHRDDARDPPCRRGSRCA